MNPITRTEPMKAQVANQVRQAEHDLMARPVRQSALARTVLVMAFVLPVVTLVGIMLFNMAHGAPVTHVAAFCRTAACL
jgi:hypothetical protein